MTEIQMTKKRVWNFENWNLEFVCDLDFAIWNFRCCASAGQALSRTYGRFFA